MKDDDKTVDDIYQEYQWKQTRPPFKNKNGEYVNEFGEGLDMKVWDNVATYQPHKIKSAIHRMKKRGIHK